MDGENNHKKILVVEDENIIALNIQAILDSFNYNVVGIASNCEDAIDLAIKHEPNIVLMDISIIGNRDGVETAIEIQKIIDTSIIFVTAFPEKLTVDRFKNLKPCGFLSKPFSVESLNTAIKMALFYKVNYGKKEC